MELIVERDSGQDLHRHDRMEIEFRHMEAEGADLQAARLQVGQQAQMLDRDEARGKIDRSAGRLVEVVLGFDDGHIDPRLAEGDGGQQADRPGADDQNFGIHHRIASIAEASGSARGLGGPGALECFQDLIRRVRGGGANRRRDHPTAVLAIYRCQRRVEHLDRPLRLPVVEVMLGAPPVEEKQVVALDPEHPAGEAAVLRGEIDDQRRDMIGATRSNPWPTGRSASSCSCKASIMRVLAISESAFTLTPRSVISIAAAMVSAVTPAFEAQ